MTGVDAFAELAVRPLRFGDATLIEADRVASLVEELREITGTEWCSDCEQRWVSMDEALLAAHLANVTS